jgi:long-chain acyl-CoA synthetase
VESESSLHLFQSWRMLTHRLLVRGVNVTPGYLHDPANTKKLLEPDGWMHTGEWVSPGLASVPQLTGSIAEIDSAGRIKIVDRVKNVVKLSQGYVFRSNSKSAF